MSTIDTLKTIEKDYEKQVFLGTITAISRFLSAFAGTVAPLMSRAASQTGLGSGINPSGCPRKK